MTLEALAHPSKKPTQREEQDRPEREADLIAEALRRRAVAEHLKAAFSPLIARPN